MYFICILYVCVWVFVCLFVCEKERIQYESYTRSVRERELTVAPKESESMKSVGESAFLLLASRVT